MSTDPKTVEDIVKALRCHQSKERKPCLSCSCEQQQFCDTRHDDEIAELIESLQAQLSEDNKQISWDNELVKKLEAQLADARNELCQKCGTYKYAHKGACDGCRWRKGK